MDDFSNNTSTSGILNESTPVSGVLETTGDVDWFAANVFGWVEIRVEGLDSGLGSLDDPALKGIEAPNDQSRSVLFRDNDRGVGRDPVLRLHIDSPNMYFAVASLTGGTGSYTITAANFLDHADSFDEVPTSILDSAASGFEHGADRDLFLTSILRFNRSYRINAHVENFLPGNPDWQVSVYDSNQNLVEQVLGEAADTSLVFDPISGDGNYYVALESLGNVGRYHFTIRPVDDSNPGCSDFECPLGDYRPLPSNGAPVIGDIEVPTDSDPFRAEVWSGGYYVLTIGGYDDINNIGLDNYVVRVEQRTPQDTYILEFSGTGTQQFEVIPVLNADFEIVVSSDSIDDGKYEISVLETPPIVVNPGTPSGLMYHPVDDDSGIPIHSLIDTTGVLDNTPETYQIWHQPGNPAAGDIGRLTQGGFTRGPDQLYTIDAADLYQWQLVSRDANAATINGTDEIFIRAASNGIYTPWQRLRPQIEMVPRGEISDAVWDDHEITFSFMDELPAYLGGFGNFSRISGSWETQVRAALNEWDRIGAFQLVEATDSDDVDIRIGSASFGSSGFLHAGAPGESGFAGDILLNTDRYTAEFAPGDQYFQQLMRGIGYALGLSDIPDASITVADSILRTYSSDGLFPSGPMRLDQLFIQEKYGLDPGTGLGDSVYRIRPGNQTLNTIYDAGGYDTVDASSTFAGVHIAIHQGGRIDPGDGPVTWIGYGTEIERLTGGIGDDYLAGNELDNKITGRFGNDFLYGMQGDDVLLGGIGNDRYGYRLGDGNDLINEQFKGGRDVLHLQSPADPASFLGYENIRFTRDDADLILDFTTSAHRVVNDPGQIGAREGSIRIRNMADENSRVEVLRLDDGHHRLTSPVISLMAVYELLEDDQSSFFTPTSQYDQWGVVPRIATPGF